MESRLLQQERLAQQSESRAAHMENRIVELQRMLEGARGSGRTPYPRCYACSGSAARH